jgi:hypothetical protein
MTQSPIEFTPYLGWVNVPDPNNIPDGARVVGAEDLLRYENLGKDVTDRLNDIPGMAADLAADSSFGGTYARRVGGVISAADPQFAGGVGYGRTATENQAALQAAIDSLKGRGGTVIIPAPEPPFAAAAFMAMDTVTLWARINLRGASKLGARLQAKAGITTALIKVGATDGTDPNWHWGEISDLYLHGNKTAQAAMPVVTVSTAAATGYVATLTTATAHGFTVGDVVEVSGIAPDAYNGKWRIDSVPTTTTFTYGIVTNAPAASTQGGTAQVKLNAINVAEAGETSVIKSCYITDFFNSGIHQGTNGTPMRYANVSTFQNGDYGYDLWCDRPIQIDTGSGDYNGKGLFNLGGKSSAGGSGTDSSVTFINPKAEHHNVPIWTLDDWDGSVVIIGGSVDMETGQTGPVIRRTAKSGNSHLIVQGLRIAKRTSGAPIFEDLSSAAMTMQAAISSGETFTFTASKQPVQVTRLAQKRNDLADAASIVINLQNGNYCKLNATLASRTFGNPVSQPLGAPNAYDLTVMIKNTTAAATTTTWAALFNVGTAWTDPAAGKSKTIRFWWDGSAYQLVGVSPDF